MSSDPNRQQSTSNSSSKKVGARLIVLLGMCIVPVVLGVYYLRQVEGDRPTTAAPAIEHLTESGHLTEGDLATSDVMTDEQSHAKMLAVLNQIDKGKAQLPFLGTAKLNFYQQQLDNWGGPIPPNAEFTLRHKIASGLLERVLKFSFEGLRGVWTLG